MRRAFQLAPRLWQQGQQGLAPVCNAFAHGALGDESLWTGAPSPRAALVLLLCTPCSAALGLAPEAVAAQAFRARLRSCRHQPACRPPCML